MWRAIIPFMLLALASCQFPLAEQNVIEKTAPTKMPDSSLAGTDYGRGSVSSAAPLENPKLSPDPNTFYDTVTPSPLLPDPQGSLGSKSSGIPHRRAKEGLGNTLAPDPTPRTQYGHHCFEYRGSSGWSGRDALCTSSRDGRRIRLPRAR
jgi:hypothetical protein